MPTTIASASRTSIVDSSIASDGDANIALSRSFVYKHINGLVLNLRSIIKDDYFPGSRNVHLVEEEEKGEK